MSTPISSMALAVLGVVLYHLAQKLQPASAQPFVILTMAYFAAAIVCILSFFWMPMMPMKLTTFKEMLLPAACLGIAAVVIELGFILVYRSGWNIGIAGVVSTVSATLILIPVGVFILGESLSRTNVIGILLCLVGLFLTAKH